VKTIYSFSKNPDPAKSSRPIATFGKKLFLNLWLNFTLNPLSKY